MEKQTIATLARQYMSIWSAGGDKMLDTLAHPDLEAHYTHFGKTYRGVPAYREMLRMTYHFFPELRTEVERVIPAGNTATVQWRYTGTHRNGELFGVQAFGQEVEVNGLTILTFEGGRVIREEGIVDNLALAMQLGAVKG